MKLLKSFFVIAMTVVLVFALAACGDSSEKILKDAVDEINSDESMHSALEGLYTVRAEARGSSSIVVVFKAELEELATAEVSKAVSEEVTSEFQDAVNEMRKAGISSPKVILEFLDMGGQLVYTHEYY